MQDSLLDATLAHYRIISKIGAGGMGEVYRAKDLRLGRDVAIKLLPRAFATDPDRMRRFEQEARATSALNHPNILTVYDIGTHEGVPYIVEELLEGDELRAELHGSALPFRKVIDYARQIAVGLAAAHERGIVHRDLKPENVFVTKDGRIKILDFGIAKLIEPLDESDTNLPTRKLNTNPGMVMGTVGYMSPEQVRGQPVDHRSDIFSIGVILYEMLSGNRPFQGESTVETLNAILKEDPPELTVSQNQIGPFLERVVMHCLEKSPSQRFQSTSDLAFAIEGLGSLSSGSVITAGQVPPAKRPQNRERLAWIVAGVLMLALLAVLPFAIAHLREPKQNSAAIVRFDIPVAPKTALNLIRWPAISLSPDGSTLAFVASTDGINHLYVRKRDDTEVKILAGTEGASDPVFSPDGKWIAFIADFYLKKIPLDGPATSLVKVGDPRGLSWVNNDSLIYSASSEGGLFQISVNGGEPHQVSKIDATKAERTHRWPQVLPGSKAVIFTVGTLDSPDDYERSNIEATFLDTGERRILLKGASMARYVATGHLVYARGGSLFAVPFDINTLTTHGTPISVLQGVAEDQSTGAVHFSISSDGTLAYVSGGPGANLRRLVWADYSGTIQPLNLPNIPAGQYNDIRISPDGSRLAMLVGSSGSGDVWVYDFSRAAATRLTFNTVNAAPIWSLDGKNIYYTEIQALGNRTTVLRKPADGSREAEVISSLSSSAYIKSLTLDGTTAIFDYKIHTDRADIVELTLGQETQPREIVNTPFNDYAAALSPDGRWLAYQSSEYGRPEIYVRDMSGTGARWQVSTEGGEEPRWSRDGHKLFFRNNDLFMNVAVETSPSFQADVPKKLFSGIYNLRSNSGISYDVDLKGDRFLMIRPAEDNAGAAQVRLVLNWFDELNRLVPTK